MKKIYILTAVIALLTLSLNAQVGAKVINNNKNDKALHVNSTAPNQPQSKNFTGMNAPAPTMNELLAGIKGMSSILPAANDPNGSSTSSGVMRAPLKINSDEFLIGPYTTNDFSTNGYGFPDAYDGNGQQIYIFSDMSRSDFEQYDGDEIVGFRFALAGNSSQKAYLYDFYSWPYSTNGYFEAANRHTWSIPEAGDAQPVASYDDITITVGSGDVNFYSITVYGENNSVLTRWTRDTTTTSVTIGTSTYGRYDLPEGWSTSEYFLRWRDSNLGYLGYLNGAGTITISSDLLNGHSNVKVTINASTDDTTYGLSINNDSRTLTSSLLDYTWSIPEPTPSVPVYLELVGGQWHEFYLDEPIPFNVNDTIAGLYLGYRYWQWGSTSTGEFMYPVAVNPNSTNDRIVSYRYGATSTSTSYDDIVIKPTGSSTNFRSILVKSNGTTISGCSWTTSNGSTLPDGWTITGGTWTYSSSYGGYTSGTITIPATLYSSYSNITLEIQAYGDNANQTITVNSFDPKSIGTSSSNPTTLTWNIEPTVVDNYGIDWWNENMNGDLAVQLIMKSSLPKIEVSPETLTISDSGTNNTFTVEGSNLGTDNVGVTPNNGFSTTTDDQNWGFVNNNGSVSGTVTVTYEGRELLTAGTVTAANNLTSATVTVNYVPDLYIYCDNGASPWDFSANPALAMTNQGNGIYTATLANIPANSHILFGRASGLTYYWEGDNNRLFFGASTDGGDWGYGNNNWGYLDTDPRDEYPVKYHPIYFPEGGSYFISIDANTYIFTITELPAPENVAATANSEDHTATVTWDAPTSLPNGLEPVSYYNVYLDGQLVGSVPANQALTYTFSNLDEGNHTVEISAVYPGGAESELVPAQFTIIGRTATPTINVVDNADGSKTVSATGNGTVHLYVDGVEVSNPYTIMPSSDGDISVTVTATAQEEGKLISETAEQIVTVPEVGRSPQPTITFTDNGDGTYTITVEGTGEIAVYIDDADHAGEPIATVNNTFSFNVEQHSQVMTITVTATNQEGDLEVSRPATETYTIPAMTIDSDFKLLDPQPETSESPIDLSKLMFVDRFSVDIPNDNSHPFMYEYTLEETQVRQRSSNSVDVYAEHTGSNGKGFYTLSQIDNDTTASLVMNVRNAAMDFNLSELSAPFFYTVEREEEADGETYWGWNAVLQRTSVGNYKQTLKYDTKGNLVYNYNDTIFPGEHIQLDLDTITGSYNDYNAYVPVVWTMGFDRVNYNEDDPVHNSYGASVWTTGVAEVTMDTENAPLARVQRGWNTKWSDNNGEKCSLFMLDNVWATATMPTVNTLDYEPYMFRIFVKSKENKLRPYKYVEKDGNTVITAGEGTTNGPICVWNGYINDPDNAHKGVEISYTPGDEDHGMTITFNKNRVIREDANDDWTLSDENAMFGALESIAVSGYDSNGDPVLHDISTDDLEVFVRFYYIVEGIAEGHTPWAPTRDGNGDGEGPAGYGAESDPGGAGVATSVREVRYHGEVVSKTYYNVQGIKSEQPFSGVNIVVTRYSDGATVVTKVMK